MKTAQIRSWTSVLHAARPQGRAPTPTIPKP